ncbi:MAG: hypothetical protein ACLQU3_32400, partial [Limisphaerales bacterium]
ADPIGCDNHGLNSQKANGEQQTATPALAATSQMTFFWRLSGRPRIHGSQSTISRSRPVTKKAMPPMTSCVIISSV